ncbi:MAG: response regulator [Candidatus Kerfeldbacteria bacterium]
MEEHMKVLVIEDDPDVRKAVGRMITIILRCPAVVAETTTKGLEIFGSDEAIDLVVSDYDTGRGEPRSTMLYEKIRGELEQRGGFFIAMSADFHSREGHTARKHFESLGVPTLDKPFRMPQMESIFEGLFPHLADKGFT